MHSATVSGTVYHPRRLFLPGVYDLPARERRIGWAGQGNLSIQRRPHIKNQGADDQIPALVESAVFSTAYRRNWAQLIQKSYEIDPQLCPKCWGQLWLLPLLGILSLSRKY